MFVEHMKCSQEDEHMLVLEVPTAAFRDTMFKAMGQQLRDAVLQAWGTMPSVKWVFTDMLANPDNSGQGAGGASVVRASGPVAKLTPVAQPTNFESHLIEAYTFDSYCEGISNRAAVNMARAMAENPDVQTFNPFFLYGPSGVGKTHLVNAVGNAVREKFPDRRVLFVSARNFQVQYADAAMADRNNRNSTAINSFIHFYQSIDMLIIDDFQEISGEKTLKAFFHIFNHLHANGRKMLFTCVGELRCLWISLTALCVATSSCANCVVMGWKDSPWMWWTIWRMWCRKMRANSMAWSIQSWQSR